MKKMRPFGYYLPLWSTTFSSGLRPYRTPVYKLAAGSEKSIKKYNKNSQFFFFSRESVITSSQAPEKRLKENINNNFRLKLFSGADVNLAIASASTLCCRKKVSRLFLPRYRGRPRGLQRGPGGRRVVVHLHTLSKFFSCRFEQQQEQRAEVLVYSGDPQSSLLLLLSVLYTLFCYEDKRRYYSRMAGLTLASRRTLSLARSPSQKEASESFPSGEQTSETYTRTPKALAIIGLQLEKKAIRRHSIIPGFLKACHPSPLKAPIPNVN